jgi:hypothetical protein
MVFTRRITALLGLGKDHSVSETGFVAVVRCRGGEMLFLLTGPRGRGPTTKLDAAFTGH